MSDHELITGYPVCGAEVESTSSLQGANFTDITMLRIRPNYSAFSLAITNTTAAIPAGQQLGGRHHAAEPLHRGAQRHRGRRHRRRAAPRRRRNLPEDSPDSGSGGGQDPHHRLDAHAAQQPHHAVRHAHQLGGRAGDGALDVWARWCVPRLEISLIFESLR